MMRLAISHSPKRIQLPVNYRFEIGRGSVIRNGKDAVIFAYGPVMLSEALTAAEILESKGVELKVVNMTWLNRIDFTWFKLVANDTRGIFVLDNHSSYGGLGASISALGTSCPTKFAAPIVRFAINEYPACGSPSEVLEYHGLNAATIANKIQKSLRKNK